MNYTYLWVGEATGAIGFVLTFVSVAFYRMRGLDWHED